MHPSEVITEIQKVLFRQGTVMVQGTAHFSVSGDLTQVEFGTWYRLTKLSQVSGTLLYWEVWNLTSENLYDSWYDVVTPLPDFLNCQADSSPMGWQVSDGSNIDLHFEVMVL